jgi:hypothetical protein
MITYAIAGEPADDRNGRAGLGEGAVDGVAGLRRVGVADVEDGAQVGSDSA